MRVVWRLWVVREKGALFERVKQSQLARNVLRVWSGKLGVIRSLEGASFIQLFSQRITLTFPTATADELAQRRSLVLFQRGFEHWRERNASIVHASATADAHYEHSLLASAFKVWKARKKNEANKIKHARLARRWLLKRRFYNTWQTKFEDSKLEKKLVSFEVNKKRKIFERTSLVAYCERNLGEYSLNPRSRLARTCPA